MHRRVAALVFASWVTLSLSCGEEDAPEPPQPPGVSPVPGQPVPGQPMPGQPVPGQPVPGQPVPGQPVPGQPMPGQPVPGQPDPGAPVPGMPVPGMPVPGMPAPLVAVTLTANSTPPGAQVLRSTGELLGMTPLVAQIQLPADQLGLPQTFTFNLAGYQPTTATGVAVNNSMMISATLMPAGGGIAMPGMGGGPRTISAHGSGGGPIFDYHTTTARATVNESCIIQSLQVRVNGHHSYFSDLAVSLRGPAGQSASLQRRRSQNPFRSYSPSNVRGTQAMGTWTLSIRDEVGADSGNLAGFSMTISCQ